MNMNSARREPFHRLVGHPAAAPGGQRRAAPMPFGFGEEGPAGPGAGFAAPVSEPVPVADDVAGARDTADYVAQMCGELALLARRSELTFLAYILEMAREEATSLPPIR